ncbi:S1 family peptidase [Mycobacterium haemophilum]|uniref:Trypsin n=1 Tax=Mycobacterium haemophilum TaxID=29311 RepID=A0A0I9UBB7_9MYCO|nr:S1 family peptidase [Mycobacterium haemophilum]KLO26820.1 trypsin [Mycobacterium haemophilum]KLO38683.1 trypsin [Mycobacterium haemophilum]KLO45000.1 trypsin [Mycobacterium haemophilum]KLO56344.1 trypsin [Mycobacterium haemophilum]
MAIRWLPGLGLVGAAVIAQTVFTSTALADYAPGPGIEVQDENSICTTAFAARGNDGSYYLMTSGHCDAHNGSVWTYGQDVPLGKITASENEGANKDAAIIRLDPSLGEPNGDVDSHRVRDVLSGSQIQAGMPFCKVGAITGETCGVIKSIDDDVVEASVYSLSGDSGSPGFVKNADGTVSAVGILMSSPEGDDHTTYFVLVHPLLEKWGLQILP